MVSRSISVFDFADIRLLRRLFVFLISLLRNGIEMASLDGWMGIAQLCSTTWVVWDLRTWEQQQQERTLKWVSKNSSACSLAMVTTSDVRGGKMMTTMITVSPAADIDLMQKIWSSYYVYTRTNIANSSSRMQLLICFFPPSLYLHSTGWSNKFCNT